MATSCVVNSSERIDGYDPATGELRWHADAPRQTPIPSAVFHDGLIYMTRGYRNSPYLALRPGGRGDVTASHVVWRAAGGGSYAASLVAYDGLLYMTNDVGVLTCADMKTGERIWQTRLDGVFFASPVAADGKIYFLSQTGETIVVKAGRVPGNPGPERYRRAAGRVARHFGRTDLPAQRRATLRDRQGPLSMRRC